MIRSPAFLTALAVLVAPRAARADLNYYNNVIVGDRALGLGGAFTAVSDDSSAVVYNPAGLGYLTNSSLSGSANAYYLKDVEYKRTIGDKSFTEHSEGFFPPFAGGAKKLDGLLPNLAAAFAIYSPDYEYKDQDDLIRDPSNGIESFHRTENKRASTLHVGAALGWRAFPWLSVGLGTSFFLVDEIRQSYQDSVLKLSGFEKYLVSASARKGALYDTQTQNVRSKLSARGLEPSIGFQTALFETVSLGVSARKAFYVSQKLELNGDQTRYFHFSDGTPVNAADLKDEVCAAKGKDATAAALCSGAVRRRTANRAYSGDRAIAVRSNRPFEEGPAEIRAGAAWFATQDLMVAADVSHHLAAAGRDDFELDRGAVTNFHAGLEYYVTVAFPLRLGVFTNNDTRPELEDGRAGQSDHIDYLGSTLALSWAQQGGQVGAGVAVQKGEGKSQKIAGSPEVQDVSALSTTLFFSATHTF